MDPAHNDDFEQFNRCKTLLNREIAKLEKQIRNLEKQKEETRNALWYNQIGDSIKSSTHLIPEGAKKTTLLNSHTGRKEIISLNPKFSAGKNAQLYYKKAKKATKLEMSAVSETERIVQMLQKLRATRKSLYDLDLSSADPSRVHESISQALSALSGIVSCRGTKDFPLPGQLTPSLPYRYFRIGKWNIYVGKSEKQNDELSIRFAAPGDLWFHVAGMAGSHVVLRRPKGSPLPPREIIEAAASLSAWYSKARNAPYAEVHQTEARFVYKKKNAPDGEVIAEHCRSVRVTPMSPEILISEHT